MKNEIPRLQNTPANIDRLAAMRRLYSIAKRVVATEMILSLPILVGLSVITTIAGQAFTWLTGALATGVLLLDAIWLAPAVERLSKQAARIQERFDTDVLQLPPNGVLTGGPVAPEDIARHSRKCGDARRHALQNWYSPEVGRLPMAEARMACQRSNLWWDGELRRRYSLWFLAVAIVSFVILTGFSLIRDLTVRSFVETALQPFLPMFALLIRYYNRNKGVVVSLRGARSAVEGLWNRALHGGASADEIVNVSRQIQDLVLTKREAAPLIFDWFYSLHRKRLAAETKYAISTAVGEYEGRRSPTAR